MASLRGRFFRDADFAEFYCPDNGRDSVPPSLLATALLLQSHDKVSDAEAKARADFDLRWKVALGIEAEDRPFAKSTLQVFRAQLILHDKVREVFESSLRLARESGFLKGRGMRVALDTTNILGRGAVKDTYNLLADGIVKLLRALAAVEQAPVREWAQAREYERYLGSSVKGEAAIDWADRQARTALLAKIVADADRLLELSRQAQGELPEDSDERERIVAAAELLGQLLLQDVERTDDGVSFGVSLKDGVSRDRMMSVHVPWYWRISAGSKAGEASRRAVAEPLTDVSGIRSSWLTMPRNSARRHSSASKGVMSCRITTTDSTPPSPEWMGVALIRKVMLRPSGTAMTISSARTVSLVASTGPGGTAPGRTPFRRPSGWSTPPGVAPRDGRACAGCPGFSPPPG